MIIGSGQIYIFFHNIYIYVYINFHGSILQLTLAIRRPTKVGEAHVGLEARKVPLCTNTAFSYPVALPASETMIC